MKKFLITFSIIFVAVVAIFVSFNGVDFANRSEGAIPTTGDLCGGTGGKGEVVGTDNNSFTLVKLKLFTLQVRQ